MTDWNLQDCKVFVDCRCKPTRSSSGRGRRIYDHVLDSRSGLDYCQHLNAIRRLHSWQEGSGAFSLNDLSTHLVDVDVHPIPIDVVHATPIAPDTAIASSHTTPNAAARTDLLVGPNRIGTP